MIKSPPKNDQNHFGSFQMNGKIKTEKVLTKDEREIVEGQKLTNS